jgi:sugar-specific transcriptional regulator TrmB
MESMLIREAGLTEGEAKVYLALLKTGSTTTGPLIEESGVANSIIYRILDKLIEKGLVSYVIKEKTKYFQAADPKRILDYIEERKQKLDDSKDKISKLIPQLVGIGMAEGKTSIRIFEGFKGLQTAYEQVYSRLKKGEEMYALGIYSFQEEKYHIYWQKDHARRAKLGITTKMLFNKDTLPEILKNRNSFKGAEARYMPGDVQTPAWIMIYKNVAVIFLQSKEPVAVEIIDQEVSDTFMAYFNDYWGRSKKFVYAAKKK